MATPGHTPGHQALQVRTADGDVVLCGDACYFRHLLDDDVLPPTSWNADEQRGSYRRLRDLEAAGAELVLSHDPVAGFPTRGMAR